ncbi:hypothetical protein CDL15_Pgr023807 [Punica granatum]|uniref:Uncharacterized protein n=1 Tax=Punica granatum TaxID=22663 RepID=A0A218VY74_PUNGR|nr:hypothetical protein CDL15_Pgr023807 [Punica granatum]PKI74779.1 hypothetical protein CRG98_004797 [Punica granatum]
MSSVLRRAPKASPPSAKGPKLNQSARNRLRSSRRTRRRMEAHAWEDHHSTMETIVSLKVEVKAEQLNKFIENRIAENEKKKQGIVLFDVDDKSPLAKEIPSTTVLRMFAFS